MPTWFCHMMCTGSQITNSKGNQLETLSSPYHTEKRSRRATPKIFLFCLSLAGGSFTHVVRVHVELLTP